MAPIDGIAQAEVANRQQALVAAESTRRTAELARSALRQQHPDPMWESTINPLTSRRPEDGAADLPALSDGARRAHGHCHGPREPRSVDINLRFLKNQTLQASI
jgi:hypothetical protein